MAVMVAAAQIIAICLVTFVIGAAGLHHSIVGTIEVLMAVRASAGPSFGDYGPFIILLLGNVTDVISFPY